MRPKRVRVNSSDTDRQGRFDAMLAPGSSLAPFRSSAFRAIWLANLISAMGSMVQMIAAGWLMTELTSSHLMVALVQASIAIPVLAFGVIAGVIADNFDRRKVMLTANTGMLVLSALLAGLAWADLVEPWSLLGFTLLIGGGFALNGPSWHASVRLLVERQDLAQAVSLNSIAFNLARSVGPALGGVILSIWGAKLAFTLNAFSYLVIIVALMRWRPERRTPGQKRPVFPAIAEGFSHCMASSALRRVLIRGLTFGFGIVGFQALVPLVAKEQLDGNEIGFGLLLGAFGIGSIVTALWVAHARRRFGPEAVVSSGMAACAVALAVLSQASSLPLALAASFLAGAGFVSAQTSLNVSMQMRAPEHLLGRCMAIYQAMTFGGMALGSWAWGLVSDWQGLSEALIGASIWLALAMVILRYIAPMPGIGEGHATPS